MGRKSEFETESKNPAEQFLTWSSTNKCLSYYDKEKSKVLKFVGLSPEQYCKNVIMGWSNPEENQDLDNRCMYCKEKCQNHYCSRKCEEADIND